MHRKSVDTINACIYKLQLSQQNIDVYFADAYRSNQHARNENTNGLIRQYLPKRTAIDKLTFRQTDKITHDLNHRPRKSLRWFTPDEVMAGFYTVTLRG